MTTDTRKKIIEFITKNKQARVHDLVLSLKIGNVAIHRQLNKLINTGVLRKIGKPPLVLYTLNSETAIETNAVPKAIQKKINADYLNEVSSKLKSVMVGKGKIVGFVIVGSLKGFDVIREV